jgi:hypothetical protein
MANYYHVRISRKVPKEDYARFKDDILEKEEAIWDKDARNKIKIGDYIGFIVGENGHQMVEIYKVKSETLRETVWKQNEPYVQGNGIHEVKHRVGIILTSIHKSFEWKKLKKDINFAPNNPIWMPRGMQVVKNKHLLPFEI